MLSGRLLLQVAAVGFGWIFIIILVVGLYVLWRIVLALARGASKAVGEGWKSGTARAREESPPSKRSPPGADSDAALKILRERFARGELSEEEYERMRKKLLEK
ncbi:MAG: SHOCT domain-containing protein [Candidatus Geothermarchaeales archaeon]